MKDLRKKTVDTYNASAIEFDNHYHTLGAEKEIIEQTFKLLGSKKNPKVLEIGCAGGRDAEEILKYTNDYLGIDISEEFIKIAQQKLPGARFEAADVVDYVFPKNVDLIYANASLLHLDKTELELVLDKSSRSLNEGGVIYFSLKHTNKYHQFVQKGKLGTRLFYFYNKSDVNRLISKEFDVLYQNIYHKDDVDWISTILKKVAS